MKQITIDDILNETTYDMFYNQLQSYGIDEYYEEHFKGNCELLRTICNTLSDLPNYKEYQIKLLKILQEYFKNNKEIEVIYYKDCDYIRINEPSQSYPLYCLAMINKEIL